VSIVIGIILIIFVGASNMMNWEEIQREINKAQQSR
jgi:hypothetical protein